MTTLTKWLFGKTEHVGNTDRLEGEVMLNWLRKLSRKRHKGLLVGWIVYKPELDLPNVFFTMHPDLRDDEYLLGKYKEIANHIRTYYGDWEG